MAVKNYYTTGEASKILGISRSTVWRRFDDGTLYGKKNPITGERLISAESLESFLLKYGLSPQVLEGERRKALLVSNDEDLLEEADQTLGQMKWMDLEQTRFGSDALIRCSRECPNLMLIDERIDDIEPSEMIKSLRRAEEFSKLNIVFVADEVSEEQALRWGADKVLNKREGASKLAEAVREFLDRRSKSREEYEPEHERRRYPRFPVELPAHFAVYRTFDSRAEDSGTGFLDNVSCDGVHITGIRTESKALPAEPFRFVLEVDTPELRKWKAHCKVVRLQCNGDVSAGLQFAKISKANSKKIQALIRKQEAEQVS